MIAEPVHARCDLPSFDTSAMDGWAVCGNGPWRIVGEALAGAPLPRRLDPGTCVRIATGAVVPDGTRAVLRWESAEVRGGQVLGAVEDHRDIRPRGEECRAGDVVATSGQVIGPALIGFLAATGHDAILVARRPQVDLVLLGDELQESGIPEPGRVRDSLGPQLPGWLSRAGAVVSARRTAGDRLDEVVRAFTEASGCDLLITTGGTADGPRDHLRAAIERVGGRLLVDRVAVKPGHPMLLATVPGADGHDRPLVGLPGNPHSAIVGFVTLAVPIIDAMLGRPDAGLPTVPTREPLRGAGSSTRLVAGRLEDGDFVLSPYGGSAMLRGLAQSTGFAVVSADLPAGAPVPWLALP